VYPSKLSSSFQHSHHILLVSSIVPTNYITIMLWFQPSWEHAMWILIPSAYIFIYHLMHWMINMATICIYSTNLLWKTESGIINISYWLFCSVGEFCWPCYVIYQVLSSILIKKHVSLIPMNIKLLINLHLDNTITDYRFALDI
jgi:hypothetical protein